MNKEVVECKVCGEPYNVYPAFKGYQSVCQECQDKADQKENKITKPH